MDSLDDMIGREIGSYVVKYKLGQGGMGAAYVAESPLFPTKPRVVKVLLGEYARHKDQVDRFFQEARGASAIEHPNIIEVYDASRFADGRPYILMPFLDGCDLDAYAAQQGAEWGTPGRLPLAMAWRLLAQICAALIATHAQKIIHRDLKPPNIMVIRTTKGPRVVVLDFGIARVLDPAMRVAGATASWMVVGTPGFMPPEQSRGQPVDERSDIYALGVIAYKLLTGQPAWNADTIPDMFAAQDQVTPVHPSDLVPEIPRAFGDAILDCLHPDRRRRPASVQILATRWMNATPSGRSLAEQVTGDDLMHAPPTAPTVVGTSETPMAVAVSRAGTTLGPRSRRLVLMVAIAASVIVVAAGVVLALRLGERSGPDTTAENAAPIDAARLDTRDATTVAMAAPVDAAVVAPAVDAGMPLTVVDAAIVSTAPDASDSVPDAGSQRRTTRHRSSRKTPDAADQVPTETGTLVVTSTSPADVYIDGHFAGGTPVRKLIAAGRHKVKFVAPDGRTDTVSATVKPDAEARVTPSW